MEIYMDELTQNTPYKLPSELQYLETIGNGAFGTVIKAKDLQTLQIVAIKIINKLNASDLIIQRMREEISILKQLKHKNIVKFYGYEETNSQFMIKMEYIEQGTLSSYIKKKNSGLLLAAEKNTTKNGIQNNTSLKDKGNTKPKSKTQSKKSNINLQNEVPPKNINACQNDGFPSKISEEEASTIIQNLISAIAYIHSKQICHRDLKPDNVMFSKKNDFNSLKIIDFGLSAQNFNYLVNTEYCGTLLYMAPEQIEKKLYNFSVDIWSLGIIMYMLLNNGKHPFFTKGDKKIDFVNKLKSAKFKYQNKVSYLADNLLKHILEPNPTLRYTADKVLYHPWVTRKNYDTIPFTFNEIINKQNKKNELKVLVCLSIFLNENKKAAMKKKMDKLKQILEKKEIFLLSKDKKSWMEKYKIFKITDKYKSKCDELSLAKRQKLEEIMKNGLKIEETEENQNRANTTEDLNKKNNKDNSKDNQNYTDKFSSRKISENLNEDESSDKIQSEKKKDSSSFNNSGSIIKEINITNNNNFNKNSNDSSNCDDFSDSINSETENSAINEVKISNKNESLTLEKNENKENKENKTNKNNNKSNKNNNKNNKNNKNKAESSNKTTINYANSAKKDLSRNNNYISPIKNNKKQFIFPSSNYTNSVKKTENNQSTSKTKSPFVENYLQRRTSTFKLASMNSKEQNFKINSVKKQDKNNSPIKLYQQKESSDKNLKHSPHNISNKIVSKYNNIQKYVNNYSPNNFSSEKQVIKERHNSIQSKFIHNKKESELYNLIPMKTNAYNPLNKSSKELVKDTSTNAIAKTNIISDKIKTNSNTNCINSYNHMNNSDTNNQNKINVHYSINLDSHSRCKSLQHDIENNNKNKLPSIHSSMYLTKNKKSFICHREKLNIIPLILPAIISNNNLLKYVYNNNKKLINLK